MTTNKKTLAKIETSETTPEFTFPIAIFSHSTQTDVFKTGWMTNTAKTAEQDADLTAALGRPPVVVLVDADERALTNANAATKFASNLEYGDCPINVIGISELADWKGKADVFLFDTNGGAGEDAVAALKKLTKKLNGTVVTFTPYGQKGFPESVTRHNSLLEAKLNSVLLFTHSSDVGDVYNQMTPAELKDMTILTCGQSRVLGVDWQKHSPVNELFKSGMLPQGSKTKADDFSEGQILSNIAAIWSDLKAKALIVKAEPA